MRYVSSTPWMSDSLCRNLDFTLKRRHLSGCGCLSVVCLYLQSEELYQLVLVAFCLSVAWCSDYLGLSIELGAFVAGVMV